MGLTRIRAEQISDIDYKQAVRVVQTTNVTLAGGAPNSVDGVNLSANDRVLVTGQSTGSQNGLYRVQTLGTGSNGTWIRSSDANADGEIEAGMIVMVTEGEVYKDTQWKLTTNDPIVIGATALTFVLNAVSIIGGSTTQVQYNSGGVLAGSPNLTFDGANLFIGGVANVAGNILPAANITYDLGSSTERWKDLWLSNSTIYLGSAQISADGNAVVLPANTVIGGNPVVTEIGGSSDFSANVTAGNLISNGIISATGNITGDYFIGNGSQLTGLPATYGNADVATYLPTYTGNLSGGNLTITSGVIYGSGTGLTNLPASNISGTVANATYATTANLSNYATTAFNVSGSNVTGTVANATYAVTANAASYAGTVTTAAQPNITSVGSLTSLTVTGNASTGNVSGTTGTFTNVAGTLTTAAQTNITSVGTLGSLTVTGNVSAGNLSGTTGTFTNLTGTLTTAAQPNITSVGTLGSLTVTGNITGGNLKTTNITISSDSITSANSTITIDPAAAGTTGLVVIAGNLQVQGTTTTIDSTTITINDLQINVANNAATASDANLGGIGVGPVGSEYAKWIYNNTSNAWTTAIGISATGNITGGNLSGTNVSGTLTTVAQPNITSVGTLGSLTVTGNITGGNLLGKHANGTSSVDMPAAGGNVNVIAGGTTSLVVTSTGANVTGTLNATGNANVGNLGATNIVGTLTTASQTNITSVGTLGSLTVTGNIAGGNLTVSNVSATLVDIATTTANIANVSNVQSWTYTNKSFSVATQDTEPRGVFFRNNGTSMYVMGQSSDTVLQYNLSSAWDVTTAVYSNNFSVTTQDTTPYDLYIDSSGTRMYVVGGTNDRVYQYSIGTAWTVNTASYVANVSVTTEETDPQSVYFKSDGTRMFVLGTVGDDVNQYDLSVAWDITTAVYSKVSTAVTTYETSPQGLSFSSDGSKMWVVGSSFGRIVEYLLPTPWDVGTITFNGYVNTSQLGTYQILGISGMFVDTGNNVAYISDYQNDRIFQLSTNIPAPMVYGNILNTQSDMVVGQNLTVNQAFRVNGTIYATGTATLGAASSLNYATSGATSNVSLLTGSTTGSINFGTGLTTGQIVMGGTSQTGAITLGQSTGNITINLGSGATTSTNTKNINIGTAGVALSNTAITVGSAVANANVNTTIYGNVTVSDTLNQASARTSFRVLNGTRYMFLSANLSGGSYNTLTTTGDTGLIFSNGTQGTGSLFIAPWANASTGIRIDSTSNVANIRLAATTVRFDGDIINGQANGVGNIGNSTGYFNTIFAKATSAQYADLAEIYIADAEYPAGTVVVFGGEKEITQSTSYAQASVAGVVSTNPAYIMNAGADGLPVALQGRVPCRVIGRISKGDLIASGNVNGVGTRLDPKDWAPGSVIGKALSDYHSESEGIIEVVVGRV